MPPVCHNTHDEGERSVYVYGVLITQDAINAAIVRMQEKPFTATMITTTLKNNGIEQRKRFEDVAYRAADRVIQQQRKAGNIAYDGKVWRWIK
jgi:hypothetical protein